MPRCPGADARDGRGVQRGLPRRGGVACAAARARLARWRRRRRACRPDCLELRLPAPLRKRPRRRAVVIERHRGGRGRRRASLQPCSSCAQQPAQKSLLFSGCLSQRSATLVLPHLRHLSITGPGCAAVAGSRSEARESPRADAGAAAASQRGQSMKRRASTASNSAVSPSPSPMVLRSSNVTSALSPSPSHLAAATLPANTTSRLG